jgi:hypothetical protein
VLGKLPGVQWIERGGILREAFVGRCGGVELFPRVLDERLAEVRMSLPQGCTCFQRTGGPDAGQPQRLDQAERCCSKAISPRISCAPGTLTWLSRGLNVLTASADDEYGARNLPASSSPFPVIYGCVQDGVPEHERQGTLVAPARRGRVCSSDGLGGDAVSDVCRRSLALANRLVGHERGVCLAKVANARDQSCRWGPGGEFGGGHRGCELNDRIP